MARPTGFEPVTPAFGGQYSIQLSYGRVGSLFYAIPASTPDVDGAIAPLREVAARRNARPGWPLESGNTWLRQGHVARRRLQRGRPRSSPRAASRDRRSARWTGF